MKSWPGQDNLGNYDTLELMGMKEVERIGSKRCCWTWISHFFWLWALQKVEKERNSGARELTEPHKAEISREDPAFQHSGRMLLIALEGLGTEVRSKKKKFEK